MSELISAEKLCQLCYQEESFTQVRLQTDNNYAHTYPYVCQSCIDKLTYDAENKFYVIGE